MNLLSTIIVGLIAGWLASKVMKTNTSLFVEMILGVVGGVVGGWIATLITNLDLMSGVNLTSIIVALIGAIIVIAVYRFLRRGR